MKLKRLIAMFKVLYRHKYHEEMIADSFVSKEQLMDSISRAIGSDWRTVSTMEITPGFIKISRVKVLK